MRNPLANPIGTLERESLQINSDRPDTLTPSTKPLFLKALHLLFPDQRFGKRYFRPPIIAFIGISSVRYVVRDISCSGVFLITRDKWAVGAPMPISLVRTDVDDREEFVTVQTYVVRNSANGVAFRFVLSESDSNLDDAGLPGAHWVTRKEMETFLTNLEQPEDTSNPE